MKDSRTVRAALLAAFFAFAGGFASLANAACDKCGTVTAVNTVKKQGEASGGGAIAGGVLGGVLGHQVGSGRGKDVATVAGAAGGAYAGHQIEKNANSTTEYQVSVKLEDGTTRTFVYKAATSYRVGDRIKVVDNKLTRLQ